MSEAGRLRNRKLTIHLFEEEFQILEQKCTELGVSKSEYIRNMILIGNPVRNTNFSEEEAQRIIFEIGKIGNNINQIAKYVNMQKSSDGVDISNLIQEFGDLQELISEVCLE